MEYGLIKDTTMTAIADSLRDKGFIPKYTKGYDSYNLKSAYATSLDDPTPTRRHEETEYLAIETIPDAVSTEVVIDVGYYENPEASQEEYSYITATFSFTEYESDSYISGWWTDYRIDRNSQRQFEFVVPRSKFKILFRDSLTDVFNKSDWAALTIKAYPLDADGNRMIHDTEEIDKVSPTEMVEAINNCPPSIPESALIFSGNLQYFSYLGRLDWLIVNYSDYITTKDISNLSYGFNESNLSSFPFVFNISNFSSASNAFYKMVKLEESPKIRGTFKLDANLNLSTAVEYCERVRDFEDLFTSDMLKDFKTIKCTSAYTCAKPVTFKYCFSLRRIPSWWYQFKLCEDSTAFPAYSYAFYYGGFNSCYALDEILDIPVWKCQGAQTSNMFAGSAFYRISRVKDITFETNNGQPIETKWKGQTIDLTSTGWCNYALDIEDYSAYNGITTDKKVIDDATYQALKNDPDWYSALIDYSRYDHDSAVRTIQSLPDTSAYLASAGGTNTIKFKKAAGSKTDGGAIENLTAEEIAVAAAKGWTVTLS